MIQKCPKNGWRKTREAQCCYEKIGNELIKRGFKTKIEPRIPAEQGLKIPDLCAWRSDTYIVCDIAVASDDYNLDRVHDNKVLKYDTQDIHAWKLRSAPVDTQRLLQMLAHLRATGEE